MSSSRSVPTIFEDKVVLITGGAGFLGSCLLHRLLAPPFRPRKVFTIVRGPNAASRLPAELRPLVANAGPNGAMDPTKPLIVLEGDCTVRGFGLNSEEANLLDQVDIVIHSAAVIRFELTLKQTIETNSAMAYALAEFSACSTNVKTHIYISSCYNSYFLPSGSTFEEELVLETKGRKFDPYVNIYSMAKTIGEGVVDSFARAGSQVEWGIIRVSTIGPAIKFPNPAFGSTSRSSPLCAIMAAKPIEANAADYPAYVDIIPVDICTDQILALTATIHEQRVTPRTIPGTPFPQNKAVSVFHAACPETALTFDQFNSPEYKIANPHIPAQAILTAYGLTKQIGFSTAKASAAMRAINTEGLMIEPAGTHGRLDMSYFEAIKEAMQRNIARRKKEKRSKL